MAKKTAARGAKKTASKASSRSAKTAGKKKTTRSAAVVNELEGSTFNDVGLNGLLLISTGCRRSS